MFQYLITRRLIIRFKKFIKNSLVLSKKLHDHSVPNPSRIKLARDLNKIRNIGIIAHIDAGKTTTTERMLFYSGFSPTMGEVHEGDTVMDYMPQERQRGITITSAAITFPWKGYQINLVDTPGHVDFTIEVERSLRVLDGAVAILDASAGVEAQTFTVWKQANYYHVPRIVYLNKMDKPKANLKLCIDGLKNKLRTKPLLVNVPVFSSDAKQLSGIIDLITGEIIQWNNKTSGKELSRISLEKNTREWDVYEKHRELLIESVADLDNITAEEIINSENMNSLSSNALKSALRRITLKQSGVPVLCGSSYRNFGVQPLLDAVISYLPTPTEIEHQFVNYYEEKACGLVFKIIHDKRQGSMAFVRVYSGKFEAGHKIYNLTKDVNEKIVKILFAFADDFKEVDSASSGNIAVFTGLKDAVTGDTIVESRSVAENARKKYAAENALQIEEVTPVLAGIQIPDPVFFCSIEAPSLAYQKQLELALERLQKEDPTLKVDNNLESGQTVISGMGELHIEVIKDRILKEYGVDAYLGPLQISYRETPSEKCTEMYILDKTLSGTKHHVQICLTLIPSPGFGIFKNIKIVPDSENNLGNLNPQSYKSIQNGISLSLLNGPIVGFPVIDLGIKLEQFISYKGTSPAMISAAASQCIRLLLKKCAARLLEPIMKLEIVTNESYSSSVMADLAHRRSEIVSITERDDAKVILALTPLSELRNYSSQLRKFTSGTASFTMEIDCYKHMNSQDQNKAIEDVTGFAPV